jgi:hypothetical protein
MDFIADQNRYHKKKLKHVIEKAIASVGLEILIIIHKILFKMSIIHTGKFVLVKFESNRSKRF